MRIRQVDDDARLFLVEDILHEEHLREIQKINWMEQELYKCEFQQHMKYRFHLKPWNERVNHLNSYVREQIIHINEKLGLSLPESFGVWWIDTPGAHTSIHTDGTLSEAMQLYFVAPNENHGTVFFHYKNIDTVKYRFKSIPNTGYIMDNKPREDGAHPLLWHGLVNPVPPNTIRVSNYIPRQ